MDNVVDNYRSTLQILQPSLDINNLPLLIFVNKGIEVGTHALTLEIIADTCGPDIAKVATFIVSLPSLSSQLCFVLELRFF